MIMNPANPEILKILVGAGVNVITTSDATSWKAGQAMESGLAA
jgi:hypothetical protein